MCHKFFVFYSNLMLQATKMAVSDDDIFRRRLLIEGDGGGDDKRIASLLKTFFHWASESETKEENHAQYERMMKDLALCDCAAGKCLNVFKMNLKEQSNYEKLSKEIEQKISEATEKISECKNELQQAKRIRKNRQEYDALAKVIQQHPDRQETTKQLQVIDKEVTSLEEKKKSLEQKLGMRRKQFHVLIAAIHELQQILDADEIDDIKDDIMDTS
ncbi:THO complex subunit 7 homolog isoform X3 [Mytilus edulis]|uniref:THO complex subunit 7 homolog isoform X3 n=1 Tax=Mytilus edulis TaxID=6550 RepID=UPI0039F0EAF4